MRKLGQMSTENEALRAREEELMTALRREERGREEVEEQRQTAERRLQGLTLTLQNTRGSDAPATAAQRARRARLQPRHVREGGQQRR